MVQIDLNKPCTVYFIGIGGISMSGFAQLFFDNGFTVKGSDITESDTTKKLEEKGILVNYSQVTENITDDIDLVIYTAAIHADNLEFAAAKQKNLPLMERAVMVGQIMKNYKNAVGVSGTHGKTTTTSMLSCVFLVAGLDPTVSVGGILDAIGGNLRIGHSQNFITEACEYTNSFLKFFPTAEIILNIEADHLDFFKDIDDIRRSFCAYAKLLPKNGVLVVNADIPNLSQITSGLSCRIITFGTDKSADYRAADIAFDQKGCANFLLIKNGKDTGRRIRLNVLGAHNVANALAVVALCEYYNIPAEKIQAGLSSFSGARRRFEIRGMFQGATVIDDYAHHPTEIAVTLAAAKNISHEHLWCVFQPHTYSRTRALLKEFAGALLAADTVILTDIYAAREKDTGEISSADLREEIKKLGKDALYFPDFSQVEEFLAKNCKKNDLLITMGAGNVTDIARDLVEK